ncbi:two-component system, NarL family, capsular synthesis sensor histidine kinase RcsC [Pseudomonas delhiensis]|uniref:histidine kinase n=2 Tax=Pseudomonas delhiensis TaxID=366289 RepID=A0A239NPV4_9PSED|nr:two-component system, NarL family, capsular synthesis sensor histidine kinase RcsC [Pseudomonas delhiensis]SNT56404.1 two-component system, NarL family, capsular synthesis sensor histidine kinase RcsC [Pseudomonas delhiensis]
MVLLMFIVEARTAVLGHLESLRQAFNAEQAVLLKEIDAREDSFRTALLGAEIIWRDGLPFDVVHARRYRAQGRQLLLVSSLALRPQWVFGTGNDWVAEEDLGRFFSLALQVGRATSVDRLVRGELSSSYFYSLRHNIAGIIPAPDHEVRERIAGDRDRFMRLLTRDVDQRIFWPVSKAARAGEKPLHWLPPYTNPYTGQRVLRIAGPILDRGAPFAALVMEYSLPRLSESFMPGEARGAYLILSERAEVINATESEHSRVDDFAEASRKALLRQAERGRVERFEGGVLSMAETLGDTGWLLVFRYSWRDFVTVMGWPVMLEALMALGVVVLIWSCLLYFKLRIFRPLINRSLQVFESEQLSRTLIETAPVGLGLLDASNGEPLLQSAAMTQLQARVRLGGQSLPAVLLGHFQRGRASLVQLDLSFDTHEGPTVSLAVNMAPVRYRARDALVVAFIDITEKKRLEQHLLEARDAADKANAAKSSFLAAMSHEIRTPLNAILGNLELLALSAEDSQRDRLETIRRSSDSLMAIVSDVLDFSKIEAGELGLEHIEFDALEVACGALAIFTPVARSKGLALLGELGNAATQPMLGDPTRLGQVLNNLLSNAIKFTEQGQVTLRMAADVAGQLQFEVEDTGIGMSQAQVQQAFRAFSQTDATINRRYGGTGLGLTLCQRLVEAMGGEMSVRSAPGQGSCFGFSIALGSPVAVADHPDFGAQPVLVLAEHPACRAYLGGLLRSWGLRAETFQHPAQLGDEAFAAASILVIWGSRVTWHVDDENHLVEAADWVIDCSADGPVDPQVFGRVLNTSTCGPQGLARALRFILQGERLPQRGASRPTLPGKLSVLVAEDNPVNRRLFEEQLQLLGCRVRTVEDGRQALDCLERASFDVLLTDLSMPVLDGYALARQARERWPSLPVVAATAHVTPLEQERCRAVGIARVVTKPLSLAVLERALREVCGVAEDTPAADAPADDGLLGGRDLPADMLRTFRQFCIDSFARIRQALEEGDQAPLLHELHALKGALGVYRYPGFSRRIADVEARLKAGESPPGVRLEAILEELEHEFAQHRHDTLS